jgi:hypothetical protein
MSIRDKGVFYLSTTTDPLHDFAGRGVELVWHTFETGEAVKFMSKKFRP